MLRALIVVLIGRTSHMKSSETKPMAKGREMTDKGVSVALPVSLFIAQRLFGLGKCFGIKSSRDNQLLYPYVLSAASEELPVNRTS